MTDDRDKYRADRDPEFVRFNNADLDALPEKLVRDRWVVTGTGDEYPKTLTFLPSPPPAGEKTGPGFTAQIVPTATTGAYPLPSGLYLRYDLIPMDVLREVVEVYAFGQKKHVDLAQGEGQSWTAGQLYSHRVNKVLRHLMAFIHGETADSESGRHHLAHSIVQMMMLLGMDMRGYASQDDRIKMTGHAGKAEPEQDTFYWSKSREETGCDLTELERGIK